jgi:hypothetical protein
MPRSVTKHKANGVKTSMEHQKLWIRWRRITLQTSALGGPTLSIRTDVCVDIPGPISIILLSPIYLTHTVYFTRILLFLSTWYAHSFVYSKPMRLIISSQVRNKVFGCVVCRFHIATSWRCANKISLTVPLLECHYASKHHLLEFGFFLLDW